MHAFVGFVPPFSYFQLLFSSFSLAFLSSSSFAFLCFASSFALLITFFFTVLNLSPFSNRLRNAILFAFVKFLELFRILLNNCCFFSRSFLFASSFAKRFASSFAFLSSSSFFFL